MAPGRAPVLLGRAAERELLDRLLENVRAGQSAVLVLRGEAGVGKTALLHYCARQASGFHVARIAGVESEMELPFAGLHQLCAPLLGRFRTASWSPWPRSACWPRLPRSGRCCVLSMTPSGSMALRGRFSDSSRDGCWPSRWESSSACATRSAGASC